MTDKSELRNMVMSFRVSELQLLLGIANQSRCGRKTELMQRALMLVERGVSLQVQAKIKELHQKYSQRISVGYASYLMNHNQADATELSSVSNESGCISPLEFIPTHIEVRLKHLPFYDILCDVMKPISLVSKLPTKQQECRLSFCLTDNHVKEITNSRQSLGNNQYEFTCQLQLRFCLIDMSCRQPDCFPSGVAVKINGVFAPLPNLVPTNKPGAEPKRPNRPVDITRLCRLSSSINNMLTVAWNLEENKSYCVCINLVRKLTSGTLLQRLKRNGVCKSETTKSLIKEKLSLDQDAEIATTSLRVSLLCPLGKMRMTLPCRATSCSHLQCFDAMTYLQMNEKKPTWVCPVCDRPAEFNKLIIDGLFVEVLKEASDSMEVELMKDGSWNMINNNDHADESKVMNGSNAIPTISEPTQNQLSIASEEDIIDLTETDDESSCDNKITTKNKNSCVNKPTKELDNASPSYLNDDSPTIYDLSPVHIPLRISPLTPSSSSPILLPPMAHHNNAITFNPFKQTPTFSSSSSTSPFNIPTYPSTSASIFPALGFDNLLPTDPAVLELFTLMANPLSNFSSNRGAYSHHQSENIDFLDFLYENNVRSTSSSDGVLAYNNDSLISSPKGRRS